MQAPYESPANAVTNVKFICGLILANLIINSYELIKYYCLIFIHLSNRLSINPAAEQFRCHYELNCTNQQINIKNKK